MKLQTTLFWRHIDRMARKRGRGLGSPLPAPPSLSLSPCTLTNVFRQLTYYCLSFPGLLRSSVRPRPSARMGSQSVSQSVQLSSPLTDNSRSPPPTTTQSQFSKKRRTTNETFITFGFGDALSLSLFLSLGSVRSQRPYLKSDKIGESKVFVNVRLSHFSVEGGKQRRMPIGSCAEKKMSKEIRNCYIRRNFFPFCGK